jgi:hypothetical protein
MDGTCTPGVAPSASTRGSRPRRPRLVVQTRAGASLSGQQQPAAPQPPQLVSRSSTAPVPELTESRLDSMNVA